MLFLLIYLYWCPTRFQYQMMFLLYYWKTKTVTSITDISHSPPPGAHEFTPCSLYSSYCSIFCFLCSVLYITVCPFISFALTMILSVFCQFPFVHDIVCHLSVSLWPWLLRVVCFTNDHIYFLFFFPEHLSSSVVFYSCLSGVRVIHVGKLYHVISSVLWC
jgi:hypothetical protein